MDPYIPALRRREGEEPTENDAERTRILAEKFFPTPPQAGRIRDASEEHDSPRIQISHEVTSNKIASVLEKLPSGKAPGPDGIPNEILTALSPEILTGLAHAISRALAEGTLPDHYKELITITLRKEGKKDYSLPGSYRPIALENTLAKVVEKVLATRLSRAAEEHTLLP